MKKIIFALAAVAAITLASCEKEPKTISASATVDETSLAADVVKPASYKVTFTNVATAAEFSAQTENGIAVVSGLLPGVYNVTATAVTVSGGSTYSIAGESKSASVLTEGTVVPVTVSAVKESALVLKEIFYNGTAFDLTDPTDVWSGTTYFRDQFYEIYNNSTETVYADGICFGATVYGNYDYSTIYEWDMPNASDYVFVQTVWQIPGTGTQYPIAPGESIIVAQWATDHNAANLTNGHSIDLSVANFEAIEGESTLWNGTVITDNPKAVNMVNAINTSGYKMPQWLVSVYNASFIMFKPSGEFTNDNFVGCTNATAVGKQVAITDILDAVQWKDTEADAEFLHLPAILDAGFNYFDGALSTYTGKSISRKVKETREDGTVVYQDTNNTTQDFVQNDKPEVRRNGAKTPSWAK